MAKPPPIGTTRQAAVPKRGEYLYRSVVGRRILTSAFVGGQKPASDRARDSPSLRFSRHLWIGQSRIFSPMNSPIYPRVPENAHFHPLPKLLFGTHPVGW